MKRELEALVLAYDATLEDHERETERLAIFQQMLREVAEASGTGVKPLLAAVQLAHRRWRHAQAKPSTLPPTA